MSQYEACTTCSTWRADGEFERALKCRVCNGNGVVPKANACLCNGCGKSLYQKDGTPNEQIPYGLPNIEIVGGYGSDGLLDCNKYTFSLCETCIRTKIFMKCVVPPKVEEISRGGVSVEPMTFVEDQKIWEKMQWKRDGGHGTARLHRICNAEITCGRRAEYSVAFSGRVSDDCLCEEHRDAFKNVINATVVPFVVSEWLRRMREPAEVKDRPDTPEGERVLDFSWDRNTPKAIVAAMFSSTVTKIVAHTDREEPGRAPVRVVFDASGCLEEGGGTGRCLFTGRQGFNEDDESFVEAMIDAWFGMAIDGGFQLHVELRDGWFVSKYLRPTETA